MIMDKLKIRNRLAKDKAVLWTVCLFAALTAVPLFAILGEVLLRGYDQLSWSFFTEPTPTAYKALKASAAFRQYHWQYRRELARPPQLPSLPYMQLESVL